MLKTMEKMFYFIYFWIPAIFIGIYVYLKYVVYAYWKKRGVPYVTPQLPFSNALSVALGKISIGNHLKENYEKLKQHRFHGIYTFHKPILMINEPELIRQVLMKDFNKFCDRGMYLNEEVDPLTGNLFFVPGDRWKKLRAKFTPTFTSSKLKEMFPLVKEVGDQLIKSCDKALAQDDIIEFKDLMGRYTTDSISTIAFGYNCNSLHDGDNEFKYYAAMAFNLSPTVIAIGAFAPAILDILHVPAFKPEITKFFIRTFQNMINYRRQNNVVRKDFLNLLMQLMDQGALDNDNNSAFHSNESDLKKLTMTEAQAQAFVFFLAGYEASSSTITYALYELALNPEIQQTVHEEIDEFFAKGELTYDRLNELRYLDMVFSETLRKHSSFSFLMRHCTEDWHIPDSNVKVEKGLSIVISITGIHHDPDKYPDPEKFDPTRFSEDNIARRSSYAYLPFGSGPRNCIGARFGTIQSKLALVVMLSKYKLSTCEKTVVPITYSKRSIVQTPACGVYLRLEKRDKYM